jgi:hypothetical protein
MADSEMTEHISTSKMELFCARGLPETELATVARHTASCSDCGQQFVSTLRRQKGATPLSFTLAPEFWLRHEHVDYDQLVELGDARLDAAARGLIELHLKVCPPCKEDVSRFLAFREQIARELEVSYAPVERAPAREGWTWGSCWGGLAWKPVFTATVIVVGITIAIGAALLLKRRAENLQAKQVPTPQVSPISMPNDHAANLSSPTVWPDESPIEKPVIAESMLVLNDRGGTITVDKTEHVSGLDDVSAPTRNEIAQVLFSGRIDRPLILRDLSGQDSALRGSNRAQPFKLISPGRTVLVTDRPTFKWENILGASDYTVYINDTSGQIVATSGELTPDRREWLAPKSLERGEIYAWTVTAIVDGKEIVSPGPSSPEMKFQVLSLSSLQQLNQLKKTRSHLALGIFYAREGMIAEAERELQIFVRNNPRSQHANKLLMAIQSWQRR